MPPVARKDRSMHVFQDFLASNGLRYEDYSISDPTFLDKVKLKVCLLREHELRTQLLLEWYHSTGQRGLTMMGELVNLKSQILEREQTLKESEIDPLTDFALQKAKKREFEIVKFLESIEFDREKSQRELNSKSRDKDHAFIVDAKYWEDADAVPHDN